MSVPGSLKVLSEPGCGNAPRHEITRRLAVALAAGDQGELQSLLAPDAEWNILGETTLSGLPAIVDYSGRTSTPTELRVLSIITHGREASLDGETVAGDGNVSSFCHVIRFASTAKSAFIKHIRTYRAAAVPQKHGDGSGSRPA